MLTALIPAHGSWPVPELCQPVGLVAHRGQVDVHLSELMTVVPVFPTPFLSPAKMASPPYDRL